MTENNKPAVARIDVLAEAWYNRDQPIKKPTYESRNDIDRADRAMYRNMRD